MYRCKLFTLHLSWERHRTNRRQAVKIKPHPISLHTVDKYMPMPKYRLYLGCRHHPECFAVYNKYRRYLWVSVIVDGGSCAGEMV
jgi:hypothetical protein